jgi:hypothetical protein
MQTMEMASYKCIINMPKKTISKNRTQLSCNRRDNYVLYNDVGFLKILIFKN